MTRRNIFLCDYEIAHAVSWRCPKALDRFFRGEGGHTSWASVLVDVEAQKRGRIRAGFLQPIAHILDHGNVGLCGNASVNATYVRIGAP
jgi:hypothetical protein